MSEIVVLIPRREMIIKYFEELLGEFLNPEIYSLENKDLAEVYMNQKANELRPYLKAKYKKEIL